MAIIAVLLGTTFIDIFRREQHELTYKLTASERELVGEANEVHAGKLVFDKQQSKFLYNQGYDIPAGARGVISSPRFSASFSSNVKDGVQVSDPATKTSISFKPLFGMSPPRKDKNQLVYRLDDLQGKKVYTLGVAGFKEDVILNEYTADTVSFDYEISAPEGTEARIEKDGSLSVYGVSPELLGEVSTGTPQDADLLKKARQNARKTNRLFSLPAPFAKELHKAESSVKVVYKLQGNRLTVEASGLEQATYPISIDPSVYVETAAKLMRGNNETNVDFDVANELIQKGSTTGARFNEWNSTMSLNDGRWNHGTAVAGGYIYSVGGMRSNLTTETFSAPGSDTFVVPTGITSITVKMWGAGGGGGGGSTNGDGGAGGGAGFVQATLAVTPGETLNVHVGGGGGAGDFSTGTSGSSSGDGGGGGGHSEVERGSTPLLIAGGGGGGGGGDNSSSTPGGQGGVGGGTNGGGGGDSSSANGGGGGTTSAGGTGGSGTNTGSSGSTQTGGSGGDGRSGQGTDGSKNNGGVASGGDGGNGDANSNGYGGGGGGGSGRFGGGGGGGSVTSNAGGGGGGGGSSLTSGTSVTNTSGSSELPGNDNDSDRAGAGQGGTGGGDSSSGTSGTDGRVIVSYSSGGGSVNEVRPEIYWAHFDTVDKTIKSPSPGTDPCTDWCTDAAYNLPSGRAGLSLVAYNGFLYAIGGIDSTGARSNHIYIAKLGANGEPSQWHPTSTNKNDWVYWYRDTGTNLSSERSYLGAAVYNNRLYIVGGQTNASSGGVTTVEYADINPTGTLSSWSTTGMSALPSARHNHSVQIYNDRIYLIGGNSNGTLQDNVYYAKLNSDGTMNSWVQTSSFSTARMAWGGNFTTVWGGYLYLMGGCTAVNASGYCTVISSDIQLASINADGSLAQWGSIIGLSNQRIGYSLVGWRNTLYRVGGCVAQSSSTGDCTNVLASTDFGLINQDGDASTVNTSAPSGTAPCSGATPTNCDIPPAGDNAGQGGRMSSGVAINNGYIYIIGGCQSTTASSACSAGMSGNISYAAIGSDGSITAPATCSGTSYGAWCVDSTNRINGTAGVGTMGTAVFNNTIYAVGGTNGSSWLSNVYRVGLNDNGSLAGAWSAQSFASVGIGAARGYSYVFSRANPGSAGTNPGNLYVIGGCSGAGGVGCSTYYSDVYKCNIATAGTLNGCTTSGQLQIDSEPDTGGVQGLGLMAGTLYANYIYLLGGSTPNQAERGAVMYAKIDASNNIVATTGSIWQTSPNTIEPIRRRGFAFGYNGYLYSLAGYNPDDSLLNDLLFAKIDVSDGSIGTFNTSKVTVTARWDLRAIVSNGYVYAIGGCSTGAAPSGCSATESSIQTFQLYNNDNGAPAEYTASANLFATDRMGASSTIHNGYIYVAGGCTSTSDCTNAINNVQYAPIDANGNIGAWSGAGAANLPAARAWGQLEVAGGTLYYIGGQPDSVANERPEVYYATPNTDGTITSWSTASFGLPQGRTQHSAAVWNNRIYVTGGYNTSAAPQTTVYVSPQLNSGGDITNAWDTTTSFNVARTGHTTIAYANNLYTLGGYDGSNYLNDVQYNKINADGTLGATWTDTTSLPTPIRQGEGFAANGYMYLIGGRSSDTVCHSNTLVAPISANTTIASGNNPTGIGEWYETNVKYNGNRYGAAVAYNDGKAYVLGGACGSTLSYTGADRVVQTALQSQAQVAKYSRMIDTDSDVFPTKWLINGLDNSVGARWKLRYRSSTSSAAAWGQETNFGTVALGMPDDFIPLDASGANTFFARYYYLRVTIDSSQAYGYPDDVTRGPTITDVTLFYTSDPSKRMRHGKTFTGGEKQPFDTPF